VNDCVFCEILAGRAPASSVYEDERAVALLDLYPIQAGHTLVLPRMHVRDLSSCPADLAAHLFTVASRLGPAVMEACGATGFNVWTANGRDAGQMVFHLHLHVLPRRKGDRFGLRFPEGYPEAFPRDELDALAERIRSRVER